MGIVHTIKTTLYILLISLWGLTLACAETVPESANGSVVQPDVQKDQVGFEVDDNLGNTLLSYFFYPVLMDQNTTTPYIGLTHFFSEVMGYTLENCSGDFTACKINSVPPGTSLIINWPAKTFVMKTPSKTEDITLPPDTIFLQNNELWIRYDMLAKFLPLKAKWDVNAYQLNIKLSVPIYSIMIQEKQSQLAKVIAEQQQNADEEAALAKVAPVTPTSPFNAEGSFQLSENVGLDNNTASYYSLNYNALSDVFTGTLQYSGSMQQGQGGPFDNTTWNYNLSKEPYFYSAQAGDIYTPQSLLLSGIDLKKAVAFQRLEPTESTLNFVYNSSTLPGTLIEVWRNSSYLVTTFTVGAGGGYTINDKNAQPGDTYTIDFYYPNGKQDSIEVDFAPTDNLINNQDWDVQAYAGQIASSYGGSSSSDGQFRQVLARYGLTSNFTASVSAITMNLDTGNGTISAGTPANTELYYTDLAWQMFPSINLEYLKLLNEAGYATQFISTTIPENVLQANYTVLSAASPLINNSLLSSNTTTKNVQVQNSYQINNTWRSITNYQYNTITRQINSGLSAYFNSYLSPNIVVGGTQTIGQGGYQQTATLGNTFAPNAANVIGVTYQYTQGSPSNTSLNYSFHPIEAIYTASLQLTRNPATSPLYTYNGTINWNFNAYWSLGLTLGNDTALISISYNDAFSLHQHLDAPQDFGQGIVYGTVLTPPMPGETQKPVADAIVRVGGESATTDAEGRYMISGVPVNQVVYLSVDPASLDASIAPLMDKVPLNLRPGSLVQYDPVLTETAGMDGYILTNHTIPNTAMVIVARQDNTGFSRSSPIDPSDNSFYFDTLTPGTYTLKLQGVENPPPPQTLTIKPDQDWLSNVIIKWE